MIVLEAQKTVARRIDIVGTGLHSGSPVSMALLPAPSDHGIVFRRVDVPVKDSLISARFDQVNDVMLSTGLVNGAGVMVRTVEHLMAALSGLHIDNLLIEIDGPEVPILDGSARDFAAAILAVGTTSQRPPRRAIKILKPITVGNEEKGAALLPADDGFTIEMEIDFPSKAIAERRGVYSVAPDDFAELLADARTFGFRHEVDHLRSCGLALGGSLDNAVVVDGDVVLNPEGLRSADEFVRHKALDALGDLYMAGAPIIGRFVGRRSGHAVNNRLLRALFADRSAWTYVAAVEHVEGLDAAPWLAGSAAAAP